MGFKTESERLVNRNLITLVAVIFLFYGGLSCLYSTFIPHMIDLGFNKHEIRVILTAIAFISLIGPLLIAPLVDRIADKRISSYGQCLKLILALLFIIGAIGYGLLLLIPKVRRNLVHEPLVSFACDGSGAVIYQNRCSEVRTCFHWDTEKKGSLVLVNCSYTCQNPAKFENLYKPWLQMAPQSQESSKEKSDDYDYDGINQMDSIPNTRSGANERFLLEPPHLCMKKTYENGTSFVDQCHVYTNDSKSLCVDATLHSATNQENETHSAEWCKYPLDDFTCNIPEMQINLMKSQTNSSNCKPVIECNVIDPYSATSVLAESRCFKIEGDVFTTFWSYLGVRGFADIIPVSIIVLLNTAIIVATRETSSGRSEIGRQLAWGAFGWGIFPFIFAIFHIHDDLFIPAVTCIFLWITAAVILIFDKSIPLDPPEWWWHTKIGMIAIPLSAIRKYTPEIIALSFIAIVLGAFWSIIDTYQPMHLLYLSLDDAPQIIKLTMFAAGIPAIGILWFAEYIVDYCGHANILIIAFVVHIFRFTGLALMDSPRYALLTHAFESITIVLVFVTLMLYMRHLFPRRLIATGQAVAVITTLCIGNGIGTLLAPEYEDDMRHKLFWCLAIIAAGVGTLYFMMYHLYLSKKCSPAKQSPPSPAELHTHDGNTHSNGESSSLNGNNYAPLRIYHNSRGRNGQFRY